MEKRVSFVHCADIHLDAPFSVFENENLSSERRRDLKKTFEKITDMVVSENADFLLIAGDLYEHEYAARSTIGWINEQFRKLGPKPVIIVPGNHDPYVKNSWYRSYQWNDNVHILTSENPEYFDEKLNVYFYGIGFDTFLQETLPVQKPPHVMPGRINICLFHGTLEMQFTQSPYNPVDLNRLAGLGFDYYALGHFHSRSEVFSDMGMINPGSPEPLGFDEKGDHGVYLVELVKNEKLKRQFTFVKTQQRAYREADVNVEGTDTFDGLSKKINEVLQSEDSRRNIIRINLTGKLSPGFYIDPELLKQQFESACFSLQFNDMTRPMYDPEELAKEKTLAGVFVRKIKERMEKAGEEDRKILEKALYLGLEALFEGNVNISD